MSWKVSDPMSERVEFIGLLRSGQRSVAALSREFGISRKTAYKWAQRFERDGYEGLQDQSRAPLRHPQQTSLETLQLVVAAREKHCTWGPRKLLAWLEVRHPEVDFPAPSTIGDFLKHEGLVKPRRWRRRLPVPTRRPQCAVGRPNEEWNADFKGEFRLGNGRYCYPLTITDAFSRYLVKVQALEGTGTDGARPVFERAFRELGLPEAIRTDNGSPFASQALGRLSSLSVWWIRLGIRPITTRPGKPQDNGRHERMHRTLKAETTRPPAWDSAGQQLRFEGFCQEYNVERPHEVLGQKPPQQYYCSSPRFYPSRLPEVEYPSYYEVRKVVRHGVFSWRDQPVFISKCLAGEYVGLAEVEDGLWKVFFAGMELGILDEATLPRRNLGRVLPMSPV